MSAEKLTTPTTTDNSSSLSIKWNEKSKFCLIFKGSCLKQKNANFTPLNIIFFFIVYALDTWSRDLSSDFTLKEWLFGGFKFAKFLIQINIYILVMVFDSIRIQNFLYPDGSVDKNVIIFGVDMSSLCILIITKKIF